MGISVSVFIWFAIKTLIWVLKQCLQFCPFNLNSTPISTEIRNCTLCSGCLQRPQARHMDDTCSNLWSHWSPLMEKGTWPDLGMCHHLPHPPPPSRRFPAFPSLTELAILILILIHGQSGSRCSWSQSSTWKEGSYRLSPHLTTWSCPLLVQLWWWCWGQSKSYW